MTSERDLGSETPEERTERIRQVATEFRRRRETGEPISEEQVLAQHGDLMPELEQELRKIRLIARAGDEAFLQQRSDAERETAHDTRPFVADQSPAGAGGNPDPSPPVRPEDHELPDRIGKYRVISFLGRGGQTDVFRAVDPDLDRDVVVKLGRHPVSGDPARRDELARQGKIVAQLRHPNLDRVLEFGFHQDRPFLVMEYVRGLNLAQHAAHGRMTAREAAGMLARIARALAECHRQGVIHRDVKPTNIVLGEDGEPRLIDFGMAWVYDAYRGGPGQPTSPSGTPEYMAPEQAAGQGVDPRSDLFALGAVLYYLLAGAAPFSASGIVEALDRAKQCDFDRDALEAADVPRRLRQVFRRAMAAEPDDRYRTAEEMAEALESVSRPRGFQFAFSLAVQHWKLSGSIAVGILLVALCLPMLLDGERSASDPIAANRREASAERDGASAPRGVPLAAAEPRTSLAEITVTVWRDDQRLSLQEAIPLCTDDRFQIQCRLPEGFSGSLFWLDAKGELFGPEELPVEVLSEPTESDPFTVFAYPGGTRVDQLAPPTGTEVVFLCAAPGAPPSKEDLEELLDGGRPWPKLPDGAVFQFDVTEVKTAVKGAIRLRSPGRRPEAAPGAAVREHAEAFRQALAERFPVVRGVAFPHVEPPGPIAPPP